MNLNHLQVANFWQNLESLQQAGFLTVEEGCLYLTPKGLSVENEIVVKLSI